MRKSMLKSRSTYKGRDITARVNGDTGETRHNWKCKKCGEVTSTEGADPPSRDWTPRVFQNIDEVILRPPTCEETIVKKIQES